MSLKYKFQLNKDLQEKFPALHFAFITPVCSALISLFAPPYTQNKPQKKSK